MAESDPQKAALEALYSQLATATGAELIELKDKILWMERRNTST